MGRRWQTQRQEAGPDLPLFQTRFDWVRNPRTGNVLKRLVLSSPDWVNAAVLTAAGDAVMIRQHRFGIGDVTLETPGGIVDPGESHAAAIRRETLEETGYEAARWVYLGAVEPNPAIHDHLCHHWLGLDAERVAEPQLGDGEDIDVCLMPTADVVRAARDGTIRHALALSVLARVLPLWPLPAGPVGPVV